MNGKNHSCALLLYFLPFFGYTLSMQVFSWISPACGHLVINFYNFSKLDMYIYDSLFFYSFEICCFFLSVEDLILFETIMCFLRVSRITGLEKIGQSKWGIPK